MHEGHRRRMYEKLKSGEYLYEHELLEILLFNAYARKNTNPIAHALLNAFGTIKDVLNADVDELCAVEGVGESVALYLKCIGECVKSAGKASGIALLKNYDDFISFARMRMRGKTSEVLELYCMNKSGKVSKSFSFTSDERDKVRVDTDRVAKVISDVKPYGLLIVHNHLSGNSSPSENDDRFTMEIQLMCSINNVRLYDHCIYAGDNNIYSYFMSGKIDEIKRKFSFDALVGERYKKEINGGN